MTCAWPLINVKGYWLLLGDTRFTRNRLLHDFLWTVPDGTRVVFLANGAAGLPQNDLSYLRVLGLFPQLRISFCWALEKKKTHAIRFGREWFWIPGPMMQELIAFLPRLEGDHEQEINFMELQARSEMWRDLQSLTGYFLPSYGAEGQRNSFSM